MPRNTPAQKPAQPPKTPIGLIITVIMVAVVGIGIIVALVLNQPGSQTTNESGESLITSDTQLITPAGGEVELVEFADFQCPACAAFEPHIQQLRADLGDRVTIGFRHLPLDMHDHAVAAAIAAEAAGKQGAFVEMHDVIFAQQSVWSGMDAAGAAAAFRDMADEIGLDLDRYDADITDPLLAEKVNTDKKAAEDLGVRSTPTFYVNGVPLQLQKYTDVRDAVEKALAE